MRREFFVKTSRRLHPPECPKDITGISRPESLDLIETRTRSNVNIRTTANSACNSHRYNIFTRSDQPQKYGRNMQLRAIIATRRECGPNMSMNLHQLPSRLVENDRKAAFGTVRQRDSGTNRGNPMFAVSCLSQACPAVVSVPNPSEIFGNSGKDEEYFRSCSRANEALFRSGSEIDNPCTFALST